MRSRGSRTRPRSGRDRLSPSHGRRDRAFRQAGLHLRRPPADGSGRRHARLGAAGERRMLVGRGFKYHRPRGIVTAGSAEPNALVTLGRAGGPSRTRGPRCRSSMTAWRRSARTAGRRSIMTSARSTACCRRSWVRASTTRPSCGRRPSGRRSTSPSSAGPPGSACELRGDPDGYEKSWAHCDLLVIGAGPTGLAAALSAGRAGARVIIVRRRHAARRHAARRHRADRRRARPAFAHSIAAELAALPNVRMLTRTTVFGWYDRTSSAPSSGCRSMCRSRRPHAAASSGCGGSWRARDPRHRCARSGRWSSAAMTGRA